MNMYKKFIIVAAISIDVDNIMKNYLKLAISIVIPFIASAIGGFFTVTSIDSWYSALSKPFFNPPNWIFGPVWTLLYLLMGIALYLVWVKRNDMKAFILFGVQLVLNALWSIFFFGLQNPLLAFIEIIFLWAAIFMTIMYFYSIKKVAAYMLIPYILWVTFAAILNFYIMILN